MSKIQNEDVKSLSDLTGAGGSASQLINDTKIYVTADGINKQLSQAIIDGDIGGGGGGISKQYNGTFQTDISNYWSVNSGSYSDLTATGTPTLTERFNNSMGTVTYTSGTPSITFTAPNTGVLCVKVSCVIEPPFAQKAELRVVEGSNYIGGATQFSFDNISGGQYTLVMFGYLSVTASTSYTIKVQARSSSGTVSIVSASTSEAGVTFDIHYV